MIDENMLPIPTPEQAIENLRDDGFWPEAQAFENLLRESRYHNQEIESLITMGRRNLEDLGYDVEVSNGPVGQTIKVSW